MVIIGGGIVGTSAAFHLAEAGAEVVLFERDQLGSGSTSKAAGGVRAQFSDPLNIRIAQRSLECFKDFARRPGWEIDLHEVGYLFLLTREEEVEAFTHNVALLGNVPESKRQPGRYTVRAVFEYKSLRAVSEPVQVTVP